jgi:aminoglycoside phosphotransferase
VLASRPTEPTELPASLRAVISGRAWTPVWRNELGGLTFRHCNRDGQQFLKLAPAGSGLELGREIARLCWAGHRWPVPQVLAHGENKDGGWLLTLGLPGTNAVSERWLAEPAMAVRAIGEGLRGMHDCLPVRTCPFSWNAASRIADAHRRANAGQLDPTTWHAEYQPLGVAKALELIDDRPPIDQLVVCSGDSCAPKTLIGEDGHWTGHVDLGSLGVADRWADLAVATWSTQWNYGPGWERPLLDAYGIEPDQRRLDYYRLPWDLGP